MGYSLGVDLGTTFSAAAVRRADRVEMVTLGDHSVVTPSVVYVGEDATLITGDAAARRSVIEVGRIAREFKRRLGDPTPLMLGGTPHSVTSLLACVLRDVVRTVIDIEGAGPDEVVLTHPANWGPYRCELFEDVPRLAGLDEVRTVTEPEAAAAYYAAERHLSDGDVIAVYDLGGGTFDAAVARMRAGTMGILGSPEGIEPLGGVDFDEAVLAHVDDVLGGAIGRLDPRDPHQATTLQRLRQDCVEAKESLSIDEYATIPIFLPDRNAEVKLSRLEFEDMIRDPIDSTIEALRRAIGSARLDPAQLAAVVLVGGSSRIPLVARMVSDELGRPTAVDTHPKHAVALGAAMLATETVPHRQQAPTVAVRERRETTENYRATMIISPGRDEQMAATGREKEPTGEQVREISRADADGRPDGPPLPAPRDVRSRIPRHRTAHNKVGLAGVLALVVSLVLAFTVFNVGSLMSPPQGGPAGGPQVLAAGPAPGILLAPTTPATSLDIPTVTATIGVAGPQGIAITPDGKRLYITSVGASRLSVIDIANGAMIASLYLPQPPQYVAIAPDGSQAYVSCFDTKRPGSFVAVLDTEINAITANVRVGEHPYTLAVSPDGSEVYVPDRNEAALSVLNTETNSISATIPVKPNPHGVAFSADGRTAYVADHESSVVTVINTTTRSIVTTVPVPASPHSVAVSPDGHRAMVASYGAASTSVLDTSSNRVVATVPVGKNPQSVAYAPDGDHAYVINDGSDSVSVLDTETNLITATVPVGKGPVAVAVTPDGRHAYVTNSDSNSISVLETAG